jgi:hypothetical protein
MNITSITHPRYLQPVNNPVLLEIAASEYAIGDLFYVEVFAVNSKDIAYVQAGVPKAGYFIKDLYRNGNAQGRCTFDLSGILQSMFTASPTPPADEKFQRLLNTYQGYYYKVGTVIFSGNTLVKTESYVSDVKWAWNGAFSLDVDQDWDAYWFNYDAPVIPLTNAPADSDLAEDQTDFHCFLFSKRYSQANLSLRCAVTFNNGTVQNFTLSNDTVTEAGLYAYNVKPSLHFASNVLPTIMKLSYWVELDGNSVDIPGCTDPTATNYNPAATINDGTCVYPDKTPNYQWDLTTIVCQFPVTPRENSNRVAKKKDMNQHSDTYNQYLEDGELYFYDTDATACPLVDVTQDTTANWQWDTSTIKCQFPDPRTSANRVALKLDVNPYSPTYSTYQGGPTNFQFYDTNTTMCPVTTVKRTVTYGIYQSNYSGNWWAEIRLSYTINGGTTFSDWVTTGSIQVDDGTWVSVEGRVEQAPTSQGYNGAGFYELRDVTNGIITVVPGANLQVLSNRSITAMFQLSEPNTGGGGNGDGTTT